MSQKGVVQALRLELLWSISDLFLLVVMRVLQIKSERTIASCCGIPVQFYVIVCTPIRISLVLQLYQDKQFVTYWIISVFVCGKLRYVISTLEMLSFSTAYEYSSSWVTQLFSGHKLCSMLKKHFIFTLKLCQFLTNNISTSLRMIYLRMIGF